MLIKHIFQWKPSVIKDYEKKITQTYWKWGFIVSGLVASNSWTGCRYGCMLTVQDAVTDTDYWTVGLNPCCLDNDQSWIIPDSLPLGHFLCNIISSHDVLIKVLTHSQRTHDVIIMSLLRQNDVATSFWRNNDVIITSRVRWAVAYWCQRPWSPLVQVMDCRLFDVKQFDQLLTNCQLHHKQQTSVNHNTRPLFDENDIWKCRL